jgi:thiosulfate/3-mercaptopyruvate sulfurtransferase
MAIVHVLVLVGLLVNGANAKPAAPSQTIDPIVSTGWLSAHSAEVVILDIRSAADYGAGHIPGSINEPFGRGFNPCTGPSSNWIIGSGDCLWLELPKKEDLFKTIGNLGITKDSLVVIVTAPNPGPGEPPYYGLANATRVADTLIYAGVKNVAILDGGYPRWVAEGKSTSTDILNVSPITYDSEVNKGMFVSIEYVRRNTGKAVVIDARDAEVYFGAAIDTFAPKGLGHIRSARSLPAPWMWELKTENKTYTYYTYKDKKIIEAMASGVIGRPSRPRDKEIIVYCSVGGYASSWWFVLTQVLGYNNVKFYDGSAQEWVMKGYNMVPYKWE